MTDAALRRPAFDVRPLAILLLVTLPWWLAVTCPFIHIDDPTYILENRHVPVLSGLSLESVKAAFTATQPSYWMPLTWLSLLLDATLFGKDPAGFHLTNVLLHIANTFLVYLVVQALTRSMWRSLLVAAFFSIHPLRVESVAWVTERKDVLSAFFGLLSILFYVRHARSAGRFSRSYAAALLFCLLSLMAKPLFVTLPILLLLLDYWPLNRWRRGSMRKVVWEKVPFFALALAAALATVLVVIIIPRGAIRSEFPLLLRLENAPICLALTLRDQFYFLGLSVFYPQQNTIPAWQVITSVLVLVAIAAGAGVLLKKQPQSGKPLVVGLLWFLVAMLPVLNIVQAGEQARADRFSYLPSIGLFIALVFAGGTVPALQTTLAKAAVGICGAAIIVCLAAFTVEQLGKWEEPLALDLDGIAHTTPPGNWYLEMGAGYLYLQRADADTTADQIRQDLQQARPHFERAAELHPDGYMHGNAGRICGMLGDFQAALYHYRIAHELLPDDTDFEKSFKRIQEILRNPPAATQPGI